MAKAKSEIPPLFNEWTNGEISVLEKHYVSDGTSYCLNLLPNRTATAIREKARKMDFKKHSSKIWSENEINILKEFYLKIGPSKINKEYLPERTIKSIEAKAHEIGFCFEFWSSKDEDFLRKNYLLMEYKKIAQLLGRNVKTVSAKITALGLKKRKHKNV